MSDTKEEMFVWEPDEIVKPEFKLYYDDNGSIVCYSCENIEGNYIVIDAQTYAEGRHDVKIVDGKIVKNFSNAVVVRLVRDVQGTLCSVEDMSIIVDKDDDIEKQYWKLKVYELG